MNNTARAFGRHTEQQNYGTTDATVTAGDDDLPALELPGGFVRFAVRGHVVNRWGIELPLLPRERFLVLKGRAKTLLEFFWNLLRLLRGHGSSGNEDADMDSIRRGKAFLNIWRGGQRIEVMSLRLLEVMLMVVLVEQEGICGLGSGGKLRSKQLSSLFL